MSSSASASQSQSQSGSQSQASSSTRPSTSISIPATAAAGGVSITQPPTTASASWYKIASGEYITFGWNLTSLYVQPSNLTIIASCSANGNTYPVGPTTSPYNVLPGNSTQVVWNPWANEQVPGATPYAEATYVLKIWDERGPGVAIKGGYLTPFSGREFAMYRPSRYTSLADGWKCSTCSNAFTTIGSPPAIAIFTSLLVTLFTIWNILKR